MPDAYAETLAQLGEALHVGQIARRPLITVPAGTPPAEAERVAAAASSTAATPSLDEFEALYHRLRNPVMHMTPFVAESLAGLREFAADLRRARRRTDEALASVESRP